VPAVFIPDESPEMDNQVLRAKYAEACGHAFCLRAGDVHRVNEVLAAATSDAFTAEVRRRAARLVFNDGAAEIARTIELAVGALRLDGPLDDRIGRLGGFG
jgi:UDP-N-acetylglucosamine:LPS N-acetylglucosamine transferase